MAQFNFKIVTPEQEIFNEEVDMVTLNTKDGEIGILPHHADLMSQVVAGELRIKKGDKVITMATGSGLLQMADNQLTLATDLAEKAEDIDEKAAEEAKKRAEEAMEKTESDEEYATAVAALEKAVAQLKVKRRHTHSGS